MTGFQIQGTATERYERFVAPIMAPFVGAVIDAAAPAADADILDVACGTGFVARVAAKSRPEARVTGVDVNETMLAEAAARATADGLDIAWRHAPADALPFEAATFDAVTCQQGLQFFPDPARATAEMARVTRPGGRVAVTVWAPLDRSPYMQAQHAALASVLGEEQVASFLGAFAFSEERLAEAFGDAGLNSAEITEIKADVTVADFATFVVGHLLALPWGAAAAQARPGGAEEAGAQIAQHMASCVHDDGSATFTLASYLAAAQR